MRNNFINKINSKLYHLTGEKQSIIETKHPYDNRIKVYKTNITNFKPKISFIKFLFKFQFRDSFATHFTVKAK